MKKQCYPKYSYMIFFILAFLTMLLSILPLLIKTNDDVIYKLIWSVSMLILSILLFIGGLYYRQFYEIIDENIILSNSFGIMTKIDLNKAIYEIKELDTYFSWAISIPKKWICIYEKEKKYMKFKSGCSNKKNDFKMQIIYSEELLSKLKKMNVSTFENLYN